MNETLESIARALFKSWFIDFDPVRARAKGPQSVNVSSELINLFPSDFQNSEIDEIPKDWNIGNIGDIGANIRHVVNPDEVDPKMPYIGLEHMPRKSISLSEWGHAGDVVSNKYEFKQGQILFGKLRPYFHKVGVPAIDGVCSTDILVIAPKQPEWFGLLLGYLSSVDFINFVDAASAGTKMPRTNWEDMAEYKIIIPDQSTCKVFTKIIDSLINKIHANIQESHVLSNIRDTLLPRLISGKLRIPDAERFLKERGL
jgi:type I restriction enzyme S subunit